MTQIKPPPKKSGRFRESIFVIVWYADSQYEVVLESAQALNTDEVYKEFASEFK